MHLGNRCGMVRARFGKAARRRPYSVPFVLDLFQAEAGGEGIEFRQPR